MEEKTVWSGTSSQIVNLGIFILCAFIFSLLLLLIFTFWNSLQRLGQAALILAFVILLSPLAYALVKVMIVKAVKYEVTSERIKITSGIFSKRTSAMELYRVKDYTLHEPFFYRLFHLGNIMILTSDYSTPQIILKAIPQAKKLIDDLRSHVELRRDLKRVREVDFDKAADVTDHLTKA